MSDTILDKQQLFIKAQEYLDRWYSQSTMLYQRDVVPKPKSYEPSPVLYKLDLSSLRPKSSAPKPRPVSDKRKASSSPKPLDLELLESLKPTFSQKLFELIKQQGISETDCYKNASLDRRLFSKIRSDDNYQPKKTTVFALIFGLKLNLKDAVSLLEAAGYSISHSLKMDVLIEFLIKKQVYDIITVNEVLYKYGCPLLGNVE